MAANQEPNYPDKRFFDESSQERFMDYQAIGVFFERASRMQGLEEKPNAFYNQI